MGTSISCNMAIPGKVARNCSYYGRKLIAEAVKDRSSDRQSRSCGLLMKGPAGPFILSRGFVDSLRAVLSMNGPPRFISMLSVQPGLALASVHEIGFVGGADHKLKGVVLHAVGPGDDVAFHAVASLFL